MKQADIIEGEIYEYVDNRGRHGVVLTGRKIRVIQKGVRRSTYASRMDGVKVRFQIEENGELVDEVRYTDPLTGDKTFHERTLMAKEIMGQEEVAALKQKQEEERAEKERRRIEMKEFQDEREIEIAKRLACSRGDITVFAQRLNNPDGEEYLRARSASISGSAVEEVMRFDPDAVIVQGALEEIPFKDMSAKEIAEHVIGALRGNGDEPDAD